MAAQFTTLLRVAKVGVTCCIAALAGAACKSHAPPPSKECSLLLTICNSGKGSDDEAYGLRNLADPSVVAYYKSGDERIPVEPGPCLDGGFTVFSEAVAKQKKIESAIQVELEQLGTDEYRFSAFAVPFWENLESGARNILKSGYFVGRATLHEGAWIVSWPPSVDCDLLLAISKAAADADLGGANRGDSGRRAALVPVVAYGTRAGRGTQGARFEVDARRECSDDQYQVLSAKSVRDRNLTKAIEIDQRRSEVDEHDIDFCATLVEFRNGVRTGRRLFHRCGSADETLTETGNRWEVHPAW